MATDTFEQKHLPAPGLVTGRLQVFLILTSTTLSGAAYGFTWNVVTVALPDMMGAFSATPDQISWIMISFIVGSAISTASVGWFSNRFGRRRVFMWAGFAFGVSLIGCALSDTLYAAVFWRLMQGLSGAALLPIGQTIAVNALPPDKYTRATSIWAIGFVFSNVVSPSLGGFIIEGFGWPMVFLVAVPATLAYLLIGAVAIPEDEPQPSPMDWVGFGSLLVGLGFLQVGLAQGERYGWLDSPHVVALLLASMAAFWVFLVHILQTANPFIPPQLFKDRNFCLGFIFVVLIGGIMYLPMFFVPLLLDRIAGFPVVAIGMAMASRGLGSILGLLFQSRYGDLLDQRWLLMFGCGVVVTSAYLMSQWTVDVTFEAVFIASAVFGLSAAFTWGPLNRLSLSQVPKNLQNMAFPLFYLAFEVGGAIGTAIMVTLNTNMSRSMYALLGQHVTEFNENFSYLDRSEIWDRTSIADLTAISDEVARQAELIAYTNSFLLIAIIFGLLAPMAFLFKR